MHTRYSACKAPPRPKSGLVPVREPARRERLTRLETRAIEPAARVRAEPALDIFRTRGQWAGGTANTSVGAPRST